MSIVNKKKSKVIIIDDHPIYVQGLESALEDSFYIKWVKSFNDAADAKKYLTNEKVDIVICDINMPMYNGFDILKHINRLKVSPKVLFISALSDSFTIKRAYKLGAYGYLSKDAPVLEIFQALDSIRKGIKYTNEAIKKVLVDGAMEAKLPTDERPLTPQENIILRKICEAKTSEQIAQDLAISIHTVNNHRKNILKKTKSTNAAALTKYALNNGLLD